jgi:hypothetical protein
MALIIETGTGAANSEAYADAAAYVAWHTAYRGTAPTASTVNVEAAIRRSVAFLEGLRWVGSRRNGRAQALAWPRSDAIDGEGHEIAEAEIPPEVIEAQHALTRAEIASPGALSPDVVLAGKKVLTEVKGIRWEVQKAPNTADAARATVTEAMDRINGLLVGGGSATRFLERA